MSYFFQPLLRRTPSWPKFERQVSRITSAEHHRRPATPGNFAASLNKRTQLHSQARVLRNAVGDSVPQTPWDFSPCCQKRSCISGSGSGGSRREQGATVFASGPWVGAPVASPQSRILRPVRWNYSIHNKPPCKIDISAHRVTTSKTGISAHRVTITTAELIIDTIAKMRCVRYEY